MERKHKKLYLAITIVGILAAILGGTLPFSILMIKGPFVQVHLIALALVFVLAMLLMVIRMALSNSWITKLSILPIIYVLVMVGLIIYHSGFYNMIMAAAGMGQLDENMANTELLFSTLMPMLHIGVWVTVIPMVIAVIITAIRSHKGVPKDLSNYLPGYGRIVSIERTGTRINRREVYVLTAEIRTHLHDVYTAKREMVIDFHQYQLLIPHDEVKFMVHQDKPKDFFVEIEGVLY